MNNILIQKEKLKNTKNNCKESYKDRTNKRNTDEETIDQMRKRIRIYI